MTTPEEWDAWSAEMADQARENAVRERARVMLEDALGFSNAEVWEDAEVDSGGAGGDWVTARIWVPRERKEDNQP